MPRKSQLPESLRYLNPLRRQLASLSEEEVSEDIDPSPFLKVFVQRIQGFSPDEAKATLRADIAELQHWLNQPAQQTDRLHFLLGFLLVAAEAPEKLAEASAEQPTLQLQALFPLGAKAKKLHNGWKARWRGFTLFLLPTEKECLEREIEEFRKPVQQYADLVSHTMLPVQLGAVTGFKRIQVIRELGTRSVRFALRVPGGYATASIHKRGIEWDESGFDNCLASIQVVQQ